MISAFSQCQANSLTMKMKNFLDASSSRSTDNYLRSTSDVFISVMWPRSMYLPLYIGHSHFFQIHDEQEDSHVTLQPQTAPKSDPNHFCKNIFSFHANACMFLISRACSLQEVCSYIQACSSMYAWQFKSQAKCIAVQLDDENVKGKRLLRDRGRRGEALHGDKS